LKLVKPYLLLLFCFLLTYCKKKVDVPAVVGSTADSLVGKWKYIFDYRLVATKANPTVIFDSVYSGNYTPYSFFELAVDNTFKWYRTSSQATPTTGYGEAGTWWVDVPTRTIWMKTFTVTSNGFITERKIFPPTTQNFYKIKSLSNNNMLLNFRVTGADTSHYWYWHDVFEK
jgi:hypothetical protein